MRRLVLLVVLASCAPTVDGPAELQRGADITDGDRLALQVRALPGVVKAEVLLTRPPTDPLLITPTARPAALGILAVVDANTDRDATRAHIDALAHVLVADLTPTILVEVSPPRPARSRTARLGIAVALAVVAALAGLLALRYRRGNSAQ